MSSVIVQVGQCGNQIGQQLWKHIQKDKKATDSHVYVNHDGKLRSVNVDSEPKVVKKLLRDAKKSNFREQNIILGKRGRGTNWSLGYHGLPGEDKLFNDALEAIRKEAERCDCFSGTIMIHSLSGGTGSGLGAHLCEAIRDEYPLQYMLSCLVAPHSSGESPLQHFNSLLCLSWVQRYSDGIILLSNDEILHRLQHRQKDKVDQEPVSFSQMNHHISSCLAGVLLPVDSLTPSSGVSLGMEPWELIRSACPMPALKILHLTQGIKSKSSWDNVASSSVYYLKRHDAQGKMYSSLANVVIARGDTHGTFPDYMKQIEDKVKSTYNCVSWNPYPVDFWTGKFNPAGGKDASSVTMAANYTNFLSPVEYMMSQSKLMYDAGAYLHWYWKYGCTRDDFDQAFESVSDIVTNYKEAVR
ncbi:tubulin delta chain [Lingula anatina]|uniref:Tubulin delta chain n=1 Tax=Lingula anatina TaxID=7574 RepID=A0A1S3JHG7_LINAN|nr:tubulin delta chain [Lingula anatina]|eukprot:XP_013409803.1 tubulin delta chain [Lingula anatina]